MDSKTQNLLRETHTNAREKLLAERNAKGYWEGELSSSALSTAVAVFALAQVDPKAHADSIARGLEWLARNANQDGGWGDSVDSKTNISTTLLCRSALTLAEEGSERLNEDKNTLFTRAIGKAEAWLKEEVGSLDPESIVSAVLAYYGDDRTFSAPILTMCALAGRLGEDGEAWRRVPQLPFELSLFPHFLFRWLNLRVVSYALPALIAIGLVRHVKGASRRSLYGRVRGRTISRALVLLRKIQPPNGGFLEATPLTGFVVMSLAAAGYGDIEVVSRSVRFLTASMRGDGGWPIDTNLSTWVTTLSVKALAVTDEGDPPLSDSETDTIRNWLLGQQYQVEHPYTHAAPGCWAWTDLPGGVPDADDTAGALLALRKLGAADEPSRRAAAAGLKWLLDLQNRDGGIPTFCKGWGKLPFDRSCPDITAHALLAFAQWRSGTDPALRSRLDRAIPRLLEYLRRVQRNDGAWIPLWFGNQWAPNRENATYGTAQVLIALQDASRVLPSGTSSFNSTLGPIMEKARQWLLASRNADGGWGGAKGAASTVEETALAVEALAASGENHEAVAQGAQWLAERTRGGREFPPSPIGLYFASLWYFEKLYPIIFTVSALGRILKLEADKNIRDLS